MTDIQDIQILQAILLAADTYKKYNLSEFSVSLKSRPTPRHLREAWDIVKDLRRLEAHNLKDLAVGPYQSSDVVKNKLQELKSSVEKAERAVKVGLFDRWLKSKRSTCRRMKDCNQTSRHLAIIWTGDCIWNVSGPTIFKTAKATATAIKTS